MKRNEMQMARERFEQACREQNARRAAQVAEARAAKSACVLVPMLALNRAWCSSHSRFAEECK